MTPKPSTKIDNQARSDVWISGSRLVWVAESVTYVQKQNRSTEGCPKPKSPADTTSPGKNGLNTRTNASPKCKSQIGQDQMSGGVSVICWLAAPVAMFYGNLPKFGNKVKIGNKVQFGDRLKIGVMFDQLRVSL